jgi:hypothetical protein
MERRYLIVPGIGSSRIHIRDTKVLAAINSATQCNVMLPPGAMQCYAATECRVILIRLGGSIYHSRRRRAREIEVGEMYGPPSECKGKVYG